MSSWSEFARAHPSLAEFGAVVLNRAPAYLATARADGSPRVHPVTPVISADRLFLFMEPTSPKGRDLRADDRYALHGAVPDIHGTGGEFHVSGTARVVEEGNLRAEAMRAAAFEPADRYVLFELDISTARCNGYGDVPLPEPPGWTAPRAPEPASADAPRVYLRAPCEHDRDEFLEGMRASVALHRPWLYPPLAPLDFVAFLERAARPTSAYHLACRLEDGAIAGFVNVSEIVRGNLQSAFVGYGAVAAHAGRGYLREAMELVLAQAFGPLGLHRLEANIQPGNTASIALARGRGFELEGFSPSYLRVGGEWRDHGRWAIRSEGWRARQGRAP